MLVHANTIITYSQIINIISVSYTHLRIQVSDLLIEFSFAGTDLTDAL